MRNYIIILLALISAASFTSCVSPRYIYTASPANNPYFREKGESKLTAYYSENSRSGPYGHANGIDLQAAYAVSDHFALTTGYFNRGEKEAVSDGWDESNAYNSVVFYKRNFVDLGAGYFVGLNSSKMITFNFYSGMAFGKFSMKDDGQFYKSSVRKLYVQPSINFFTKDNVRLSAIMKTSFVHYGTAQTDYPIEKQQLYSLDQIAGKTLTLFEPEFNFQLGLRQYPWVTVDAAISSAFLNNDKYNFLEVRKSNSSIGLSFDLSKLKKKKSKIAQ